jgi:prephenate dehydrogenase
MPRVIGVQPVTDEGPFSRVAIVGFGLIGGSIGRAIKRKWPAALVVAIDKKPVIEAAMRLHAAVIPSDAVVTDVGSTKRAIVDAAARIPSLRFIGGHPMAGGSHGGLGVARADLFDGHPWILTPDARHADLLEHLDRFVTGLGGMPHVMTADLHDRLVGIVSHLPQLTATALMQVVGRLAGDIGFEIAGQGLADTTRLADSPPDIWRDITATNDDTLRDALDVLIRTLTDLRDNLANREQMDAIFASAAEWRHTLLRARVES